MNLVPLDLLRAGERGQIHDIDGCDTQVCRLEEMGIRQGANIEMVQPGCPCILAVGDQRFTVRLEQHVLVMVDVP